MATVNRVLTDTHAYSLVNPSSFVVQIENEKNHFCGLALSFIVPRCYFVEYGREMYLVRGVHMRAACAVIVLKLSSGLGRCLNSRKVRMLQQGVVL